ncbi:MAG: glycogen synthase GlgA [Pseudomonadota bacterium]
MRVLSVASECVPLVKTGGLADVVGALPNALGGMGVDMRVLLPGYPAVMDRVGDGGVIFRQPDFFGGEAKLLEAVFNDLHLYVLDAPHLFDRRGELYLGADGRDWPDNPERFAALSMMGAIIAQDGAGGWRPDCLHCHDWQAGFAPYYLRQTTAHIPSVLTVHNIAFHGAAPADRLSKLRLNPSDLNREGFEFWGNINALKAGLVWADRITTVSPTYARELTRPEFGHGLDGVIRSRADQLSGILNGIDLDVWNPATDPHLKVSYKRPKGKQKARAPLRAELGLRDASGPLCVVVSRLTEQKGLDLLLKALPTLLDEGGQLALLGTGEPALELGFQQAASHPDVSVRIGYDEAFAHRLIAGGDAILVPSRFEPCGLTQLYGLRYGTIPVVSYTGGLADTVIHASPMALALRSATGLHIHPLDEEGLRLSIKDLSALFRQPDVWAQMQKTAMALPVGWDKAAAKYTALYREMVAAE